MNQIAKIEFGNDFSNILNAKIIGVCGAGYQERSGFVERVSMQDHRVLGKLVQVWVKWDGQEESEPYFPRQFNNYYPNCPIGVYVA